MPLPWPQDHYDWGLRAIKSVLVVAGSLKRGDPTRAEDQVLMRALRDFNIPKIVTDDLPVFMGLIGDLFPALDVPRKRDPNFEKVALALPPRAPPRGPQPRGHGRPRVRPARSSSRASWSCGCRPRTASCSRWCSWRNCCRCDIPYLSSATRAVASPR